MTGADDRGRLPAASASQSAVTTAGKMALELADAAKKPPEAAKPATPSMAQYLEIKAANPDSLLWYRMGDFYELFFEDARVAAKALSIVLTKRGKHLGEDIPMCGVPVVRADEYLQRLIRKGFRVAVCEQLEDPAEARKRGAKSVVKRDVVRLVTPGTITEDALLEAGQRNYLSALFMRPSAAGDDTQEIGSSLVAGAREAAIASLDISTGEFEVGLISTADLPGELVRLSPSEILVVDRVLADGDLARWIAVAGAAATPVPSAYFDSDLGTRHLKERLGVAELGGFGTFTRAELAACGALLKYVELTQIGKRPVVRPPARTGAAAALLIDAATRTSLELVRAANGEKAGSLLAAVDRTVTGPGARTLAARLANPLRAPDAINARLDAVGFLVEHAMDRADVRATLAKTPDVSRAVARLSFQRGGPRDLSAVRDGLAAANEIAMALAALDDRGLGLPDALTVIAKDLRTAPPELLAALADALVDEPPLVKRDGGYVRAGFADDLDRARRMKDQSNRVLAELEARYQDLTGVRTLKLRHNNIHGYFVEVTAGNAAALQKEPHSDTFRQRQTMVNAVRFATDELSDIEGQIASAAGRALGLEAEIFNMLAKQIADHESALASVAAALADLDVYAGLAQVAEDQRYVRPTLDTSRVFAIEGGRHPVVEQAMARADGAAFIANDCTLGQPVASAASVSASHVLSPDALAARRNKRPQAAAFTPPPGFDEERDARIWLVTGPNMAGKSTFLRQNALITVLAQAGSFVPASRAHIGVVDRLFSRVGASDDLARGRSTFMVEMVETAGILNQATEHSLVILDEIGRGTATFDGLSIAWATIEYLHTVSRSRVLFATHYHELTALPDRFDGIANATVDVKEWQDDIVFLHKVVAGAADRSYGIQVAKLAGLPTAVIARAGEVLALLEDGDRNAKKPQAALDALPLFAAARPENPIARSSKSSASDVALDDLNPDELTPRAALEALYKLKALRRDAKS